jgi:integrase
VRGDGRVFLKAGPGRVPRWYVAYYRDGKEYREPAMVADVKATHGKRQAASEAEALRALRHTVRELDRGETVTPDKRRLTVGELLDALLEWMQNQGRRSVAQLAYHVKPVRKFFGKTRAVAVTTAQVERYKSERLAAGKARATINRETEALRRAFSWGTQQQPPLVPHVPTIHRFPEDNARQGFLARADFEALVGHITSPDIRDFIEWGYWTGMRKGEAARLTWEMFDRETWTLRLHQSAAKTGKGRVLVLAGPLRAIIERRLKARRLDTPLVFHRTAKGRPGQPIKDFRKAWAQACTEVGLTAGRRGGLTFHDTRRTAVRNLIRAGVDQTVAMKISGHRTDSTFRRYNITSEDDLRDAVEKVAAYVETLPTERKIAVMGGEGGPNTDQKPPAARSRRRS